MPEHESEIMTPEELADYWRVHVSTVYRQLEKGLVPGAFKVGRVWRVPLSALSALMNLKIPDS